MTGDMVDMMGGDRRSGGSLRPGDYDSFSSWDDHFGDDWRQGGDDWRHGGHDGFSSWDDFDAPSSWEGDGFRHHGMYEDDFYGPRRSAGVRHRPGHGGHDGFSSWDDFDA